MKLLTITGLGLTILLSIWVPAYPNYKDDIGYTMLQIELQGSMPDGSGVPVVQAEAKNSEDAWMPDHTNPEFSGKTINYHSGSTPEIYSGHATAVGKYFYGNTLSIAPGISIIDCYLADYWADIDFLQTFSIFKPLYSVSRVANHSWVGDDPEQPNLMSDILRRVDWVIEIDEFIQSVGMNNSSSNKPLLGSAFNAIAVGRTDGNHAQGSVPVFDSWDDSAYESIRTRPDIVAPLDKTSFTTPMVAAAAALLVEVGHNNPGFSTDPEVLSTTNRNGDTIYNAERSEVIKAVLMAGADRYTQNETSSNITDYRADPANQTANGLDKRFGAGQLSIYNSHYIICGGEQNSLEDEPASQGAIGIYGFDYDPSFGGLNSSNNEASYYLTVDSYFNRLSASLVWNIEIDGGSGTTFDGSATLHDLDLFLYDVTDPNNWLLVGSSTSDEENTEHLWIELQYGRDYVLQVKPGDMATFEWDYALAWKILWNPPSPIPTLSEWGMMVFFVFLLGSSMWIMRRKTGPEAA